jgi:hypothetical protein
MRSSMGQWFAGACVGLGIAVAGCGDDTLTPEGAAVCDRVCAVYETCAGVGALCLDGCRADYRGASDSCVHAGEHYAECLEANESMCSTISAMCETECEEVEAECGIDGNC